MQLQTMQSKVVLNNVGRTSSFNMDANAKAFRVLSDTLYQNKIGSMVREVSCNAYDSHIQAGTPDLQFQIHMPDVFEPYFSVRDFGIGLDDDGVREVFSTYFRSTKDQDNNMVGSFGLGSKTPFAYTDAFTIVAIKDGSKRQYSAYIDSTGLPAITFMDETVTDEGNGVEIIVPVTTSDDFRRFRQEVTNQLTFFTVKPEILNEGDNAIAWMDWQSADNYMNCQDVFVGNADSSFRGVWIVQGVVGYKMDVDQVCNNVSEQNKEFLLTIKDAALLRFDLGQIEVTPSREGVSYSKYTYGNIEKVLDKARVNLRTIVQAEIDALPDNWAKAHAINTRETLRRLAKITGVGFKADGYYMSNGMYFLDLLRLIAGDAAVTAAPVVDPDDEDEDDDNNDTEIKFPIYFRAYKNEWVRRKWRWQEAGVGRHAKVDDSFTVLVKDTLDKPVVRTREFMGNYGGSRYSGGSTKQMFVLQNRDGTVVTAAQLAELQERLGASFKFTMLSEVELPAPEARSNNGYKAPTAYTYGKNDDFGSTRYWERECDKITEFEGGAYYTFVDRCSLDMPNICRVVTAAADSGLLDKPIMAIRAKDESRIADNPDWIKIEVKAQEMMDAIVGNKGLMNSYALSKNTGLNIRFMDSAVVDLLRVAYEAGEINSDSPLGDMFRFEKTITRLKERAARRGFSNVVRVALHLTKLDTSHIDAAITSVSEAAVAKVKEAYPLLSFIDQTSHNDWVCPSTVADHIVAYVNAKTGA